MTFARLPELKNIDQWAKQINFYRDHLDIFIEEMFAPIKLKNHQKIIARAFGRCNDLKVVQSRGFGKSWLVALCCFAICVQYPGTLVAVCSGTAKQATIVLGKIRLLAEHENILREIEFTSPKNVVQVSSDRALCRLKNGSKIESFSVATMRGQRAKIVVVDESPEVNEEDLNAIISPVKNFKRDVTHTYGINDYPSKVVNISSACEKSNFFYKEFLRVAREMSHGNRESFASALDYRAAARSGLTDMRFFEDERKRLPQSKFDMEYGSIFMGAEANSVFPYSLTEPCRVLKRVELAMPKGSQSHYVIGFDIATSVSKEADNSVIVVVKLVEQEDGSYVKQQVNIRSFHGKGQDALSAEVRKMYVKFPNTVKIVFDQRGLGDSFPKFMNAPWTDPESGKEYPPFVCDDEHSIITNAMPMLRSVKANSTVNQQLATNLRVALEQRSIQLPINSRGIYNGRFLTDPEDDGEGAASKKVTLPEQAIFIEADAMQVEMGNIISKITLAGTYTYDTARRLQHKDRYSSLAMAVTYIAELEEKRKRRMFHSSKKSFIGLATKF